MKKSFVFANKKAELEITERRRILGEKRIDKIKKEICISFKIDEKSLFQRKRGDDYTPRQLLIILTRELSGLSFPEIADRLNVGSYKTIASNIFRINQRIAKNRKLEKLYKNLRSLCSQEET